MEPTKAPWAQQPAQPASPRSPRSHDPLSLPAVSRGETTKAPWSALTGPALTGQRVEAAIKAEPGLPGGAADYAAHAFAPARKAITSTEHLKHFLASEVARDFMAYVLALNEAIKGRALSDPCQARVRARACGPSLGGCSLAGAAGGGASEAPAGGCSAGQASRCTELARQEALCPPCRPHKHSTHVARKMAARHPTLTNASLLPFC